MTDGQPRLAFLHEDPHQRGGGEAVLGRLSRMAAALARVDLALLFGCSRPEVVPGWSQFDRVEMFDFPRRIRWADTVSLVRSSLALRRWLRDENVGACVAMTFAAGFRGALATAGTGKGLVWVCNFSVRAQGRRRQLMRSIALRWLGLSGAVAICPSLATRDELIALGYPRHRLRVINYGVDLARYARAHLGEGERARFRRRHGIPVGDVMALHVARIDPVKNHDVLLRALAIAGRAGAQIVLVCLGDTSAEHAGYAADLRARAAALGVAERVLFVGHHEDVPAWLAAADLAVLSSHTETAGLVLLEAAAARLPLLASPVGSAPEIVLPGRSGYLFDPDDAQACARHLIALAASETHRRALGAAARSLVEDGFDERRFDRQWQGLFAELLGLPPSGQAELPAAHQGVAR